eukprot:3189616-Amphidinium_carterae.1
MMVVQPLSQLVVAQHWSLLRVQLLIEVEKYFTSALSHQLSPTTLHSCQVAVKFRDCVQFAFASDPWTQYVFAGLG